MKPNRFNYPTFGFGSGLSRLIHDAFEGLEDLGNAFTKPHADSLRPRIDLYEDEHSYHATLELPGVNKGDANVEFADSELDVSAKVSKETLTGRKNFDLKRSITLPDLVGDGDIVAKLVDGILTVSLPKAEAAKPRSITVE